MTEFTRELIYGKRPIRRTDPKPGQSEWYIWIHAEPTDLPI